MSAKDFFSENRKADLSLALALAESDSGRGELRAGIGWRELQPNQGLGSHTTNDQRSAWLSPSWRWSPLPGLTATFGAVARQTLLRVDQFYDLARERVLARSRLEKASGALFATVDWNLSQTLQLAVAARGEQHRLEARLHEEDFAGTDHGMAAQLGLLWRPREGWRAWMRYDRLFRFPVTDEIAAYQGYALTEPFNAEIGPERGHNLEVGAEWTGRSGSLNANLFWQQLDGEIAFDYRRNLNLNLADSHRLGLELGAQTHWRGWELRASYTWLDATFLGETGVAGGGAFHGVDLAGKRVPLVSPHTLSATLTSPLFVRSRVTIEGLYRHCSFEGSDFANDEPPLPGWTVMNVALRTEIGSRLTVFARLNNVFDRDYATLKFFGGWYPAPGRHARAGLVWEF